MVGLDSAMFASVVGELVSVVSAYLRIGIMSVT